MAQLVTEGLPDQVAASLRTFVPGTLKLAEVTGGAENAELTLTGVTTSDAIVGAALFDKEGAFVELVTLTIVKADKVKTATVTSEGTLVVLWQDASNG